MKLSRREFIKEGIGAISLSQILGFNGCESSYINQEKYIGFYVDDLIRSVEINVYYPKLEEPMNVLIFSHGYSFNPSHYRKMIKKFAEEWYIVVAPNHNDLIKIIDFFPFISIDLNRIDNIVSSIKDNLREIGYILDTEECLELFFREGFEGTVDDIRINEIYNRGFNYRSKETKLAFDLIKELNESRESNLYKKVKDGTGVFAHSFGGNILLNNTIEKDNENYFECNAGFFMSSVSGLSEVEKINYPTRWITGTIDKNVFKESSYNSFKRVRERSSFLMLKEVGHMTFCEEVCKFYNFIKVLIDLFSGVSIGNKKYEKKGIIEEIIWDLTNENNFIATRNHEEKQRVIVNSGISFFNKEIKGIGNEDNFIYGDEEYISMYEKNY
ncbi:MAG: hypothetical protein QXJ28_02650 [Candidatus Pacearchaeota archaeon]